MKDSEQRGDIRDEAAAPPAVTVPPAAVVRLRGRTPPPRPAAGSLLEVSCRAAPSRAGLSPVISHLNRSHSAAAAPTCGPFPRNRTAPGPFSEPPAPGALWGQLGGCFLISGSCSGVPSLRGKERASQSQEPIWLGNIDQNKGSPSARLSSVAGAGTRESSAQAWVGQNWQLGPVPRPQSTLHYPGGGGVGGEQKSSLLSHRGTPNVVKSATLRSESFHFEAPSARSFRAFPWLTFPVRGEPPILHSTPTPSAPPPPPSFIGYSGTLYRVVWPPIGDKNKRLKR